MRSALNALQRAAQPLLESLETRRLLSVVLRPEQPEDWGDLPDTYQTLGVSNGPHHFASPTLLLGSVIDVEPDGQPSLNADGDDLNPPLLPDDEDGVTLLTPLLPGQMASVQVVNGGSMPGFLNAWVDFANNGTFADPGDAVVVNFLAPPGVSVVQFMVPPAVVSPPFYARFRLSQVPGLSWFGPGGEGEVEDYRFPVEEPQLLDFGDAPDLPQGFAFPTMFGGIGDPARHVLVPTGPILGSIVDAEINGQPTIPADGDDLNPPITIDDEDGVMMRSGPPLDQSWVWMGGIGNLLVSNGGAPIGTPAFLNVWADIDQSGNWTLPIEQVIVDASIPPGTVLPIPIPAPVVAPPGRSFMHVRFRLSSLPGLTEQGPAPDGEVEDYRVLVVNLVPGDMDADGAVNNQDIAGFVLALTNPQQFPIQYPNADIIAADVNMDGVINNQDIAPFVQLLTGPRPAPTTPPGLFSRKPVLARVVGESLSRRLIEQLDTDDRIAVLAT